MILSDRDIKKYIQSKKIVIRPKPDLETQLGPCSLDLRLGDTFRVFEYGKHPYLDLLNPASSHTTRKVKIKHNVPFILHPGDFVLAVTREYVMIPDDVIGRLEGRSSIGRLGIVVHSTAGRIDPGFMGNITLEVANMGKIPVALHYDMRICSVSFETLSSPAETPYSQKKGAKYVGNREPEESKIVSDTK